MPWLLLKIALAVGAMLLLYWIGANLIRGFGTVRDDEEAGEVHPVDLRFECVVCGTQVTMTAAPDAEPVAPRHCMEEMHLVAPFDDNGAN